MNAERVLFVGSRAGALSAATRLGLEVYALHAKALEATHARALRGAARVDPSFETHEVLAAARGLLGSRSVAAVVALTERAVLPAAQLREELGVPGTSVAAALRCTDKLAMKRAAGEAGIACAQWEEVGPETKAAGLVERLGLPVVLKPARSSGSRGLTMGADLDAIGAALARCTLAERFVDGREMSVETLFLDGRPLFLNPTEYLVLLHANVVPAEPDAPTWRAASELSERVIRTMGLERGIAHVELFLTAHGPVLGEIAARPPGGRLMQLIRLAYGFDPWEALLRIELGERPNLPRRAKRTAGVWMLHPGEGEVLEVAGIEEAQAVPCVRALRCRVRPGARVAARAGSGQDVGYIEAVGPSRDAVAAALFRAHAALRIRMRGEGADTGARAILPAPSGAPARGESPSMNELRITSEGAGAFRVEVRDGRSCSVHRVSASAHELRRYGGTRDPEALVRASFEFLLEREPKEAILPSFGLATIERYFPEFPEAIRGRLA